ncbi:hypothetical protein [Sodalis sp. RH20]|uniref:hypothetical protein n=1 Tax=unclassified Sodalis (in: enterobacteria) TaxID=2636512 RepID=UPI0039B5DBFC
MAVGKKKTLPVVLPDVAVLLLRRTPAKDHRGCARKYFGVDLAWLFGEAYHQAAGCFLV